ncbi:chemotaxis protein CheW [Euhalothece natronophila Z-M001]|uniref:Chemotaxis protein CheW n=1 Tax=Euhalothece natronophila Z-M001 TaxID=522448 RepID=A0A5B8NPX5_9CHRO|nr:chemotaxis protein CheW [Euhalothece natronophila]QDZ41026.1 chemotaxis protein CheW [Euhalothece natronophila Z-M001]
MPNITETSEKTLRVIVFTLGDYYFSLPINAILQVTETPSEMTQHFEGLGLVMLENKSIMLLNLHPKLAYQSQPSQKGEFLILTQTRQGDLCGIPVDSLPNMMELSADFIQPLPKAYRQTNLYDVAPFVTFVQFEGKEEKEAIYLLDVDAAVNFLS